MNNYGMYMGAQSRAGNNMNERRLEAARQRYNTQGQAAVAEVVIPIKEAMPAAQPIVASRREAPITTYDRETLMNQIMMQDFEAYELCLYLDTHPGDTNALEMHRNAATRAKALKAEYETRFGPLTHMGVQSETTWTWEDNPWPWDNK